MPWAQKVCVCVCDTFYAPVEGTKPDRRDVDDATARWLIREDVDAATANAKLVREDVDAAAGTQTGV